MTDWILEGDKCYTRNSRTLNVYNTSDLNLSFAVMLKINSPFQYRSNAEKEEQRKPTQELTQKWVSLSTIASFETKTSMLRK